MEVAYSKQALKDIAFWKKNGSNTIKAKISSLILDIQKTPFKGLGKPEALKGNLCGFWSRRIDDKNRIIYEVNNEYIQIHSLRGHYFDK